MIFRILLNYITGFVNITVQGFFIERFINNCIKNKIFLWSIKRNDLTTFTANISIKQFKKLHTIANQTKCKVNLNSKHGFPIILHKYRKRKILIISVLPIIISTIILSRFIWNIEIIAGEDLNGCEIAEELEKEGIRIGAIKQKIDTKSIINNIRFKRRDISWMSIDIKGTNVIVNIVGAKEKPDIIDETINCNIVADKKTLITRIIAESGTAIAKTGDIVDKGDILISGTMEGKYTEKRYVHAKGKIQGKVWYTKKIESRKY